MSYAQNNGKWLLSYLVYNSQEMGGHSDFPSEEKEQKVLPLPYDATIGEARTVAQTVWAILKKRHYLGGDKRHYPREPVLSYEYVEELFNA